MIPHHVGLKSAKFILRLLLFATFGAAPAVAEKDNDSSAVLEVDPNTYLVGFDYEEILLIVSTYDELIAIIESDSKRNYASVPVGSRMTASASIERTEDGLCSSFFVGLQTDYGVFEFGIIKDEIEGSQSRTFFVADSEGGCPPTQSGEVREYSLRSLEVKRDDHRNRLVFRLSNGGITFEKAGAE